MRFVFGLVIALYMVVDLYAQQPAMILPPVIDTAGRNVDIVALSNQAPIVSIRFLGAMCTHCMQQLALFQEYTEQFRNLDAVVIAFSDNEVEKCREVTKQYAFASDVFLLCSDTNNTCSKAYGTTIIERNGLITELHGLRIIYRGNVLFEHYSTTPYMDVRNILSLLSKMKK